MASHCAKSCEYAADFKASLAHRVRLREIMQRRTTFTLRTSASNKWNTNDQPSSKSAVHCAQHAVLEVVHPSLGAAVALGVVEEELLEIEHISDEDMAHFNTLGYATTLWLLNDLLRLH